MTPWVLRLILANVAMQFITMAFPIVRYALLLVPALIPSRPWTVITYMFLHAPGIMHILFNMIALYFFGPAVEARLGSRRFVALYFTSGIMAALVSVPFTPMVPIVGASGAVFGVMLAFARFWPRQQIYIWGVLPIEARWLVIFLTALSLWSGFSGASQGVAHFAHLGGFLGGFLYLKWAEWRSPARRFKKKAQAPPPPREGDRTIERWQSISTENIHPLNREEVERLLEKIASRGPKSLTPDERAFLERFASR
jgi:membrane associated rhomboid family serine protease